MINWIKQQIGVYYEKADLEKISEAFVLADDLYKSSGGFLFRDKGFYEILFSMRPDNETIIAAILHGPYEHGLIDSDFVKSRFGDSVLKLVDSVRRILKVHYAENDKNSQNETLHKLFLGMSKDVRVILILLVYRYHILHDFDESIKNGLNVDLEDAKLLAKENLEIYAPIAAKLGIYKVITNLEDISFKYLHPKDYESLNSGLIRFKKKKCIDVERLRLLVEDFLKSQYIEAKVFGRLKSIYSIHKKLKRKNYQEIARLSDIVAIRIILNDDDVDKLYSVLGYLHARWTPVTKRFKDYVTVPKPNGYQSLHTVVRGMIETDLDQQVEVQIRTHGMHINAEYGVAAHWLYKDNSKKKAMDTSRYKMEWIDRLSQFYNEFLLESSVMKKVDVNIFKDRIFVLTPNGEIKDLPKGATPIDFAYLIHTDVGNHCMMAKVDGKAVPLDYELKSGQVISIMTSNDSVPKLEWFSKTITNLAQRKIKAWFSQTQYDKHTKDGKRIINKILAEMGKPLLDQSLSVLKGYSPDGLTFTEREQLLRDVGQGKKNAKDVVRKVYPVLGNRKIPNEEIEFNKRKADLDFDNESIVKEIIVGGESDMPIKIPACCCPRFGDTILGYVTRGRSITVHRADCYLMDTLDVKRLIFADWKNKKIHAGLSSHLVIEFQPRPGLIKDIVNAVSSSGLNLINFQVRNNSMGITDDYFYLNVSFDESEKAEEVLNSLSELKGIVRVQHDN